MQVDRVQRKVVAERFAEGGTFDGGGRVLRLRGSF
jgi:hypothetical protein